MEVPIIVMESGKQFKPSLAKRSQIIVIKFFVFFIGSSAIQSVLSPHFIVDKENKLLTQLEEFMNFKNQRHVAIFLPRTMMTIQNSQISNNGGKKVLEKVNFYSIRRNK